MKSSIQSRLLAAFSLTAAIAAARASISQFERSLEGSKNLVKEARRSGVGGLFKGADDEERLARSIEFVQEFGLALDQVGIDADRATDILQDISTRRIEALDGLAEKKFNDQARALTVLGIAPASLKDTTGAEILLQLGKNLKGKRATDERKEAMDALFGDAGVDMLVLLREGLQETMGEMRKQGLIVGGEEIIRREEVRRRQSILERQKEIEIDRANQTGEKLADFERKAKVTFFESVGSPSEVAAGTAANLIETYGGYDLSRRATSDQIDLEAKLYIRQMMREIRDNTKASAENTRSLKD